MTPAFITLEDFVPALSPRFSAPRHLREVTGLFQRVAAGEEVQACVSVPPRHSKTETLLHGIAWLLVQKPELQIAYASYASRLAEKKSRRARDLSLRAGVPLSADSKSRADWRTTVEDGGVWATSVEGAITGEGFNLVILDDLVKGRADAESGTSRERLREWLLSDVMTRLEPHASIIIASARWHPEDPIGHAIGLGWEHVNLQAIGDDGVQLWPERWPLETLHRLRETLGGPGGYEWESLYQGNPRGRGARVFGDVHFFDEVPGALRLSIGLDFAYSTKKTADYSCAVLLGRSGETTYVLDVIRARVEPSDFRSQVQALSARHAGAKLSAYVSGTESGILAFLADGGVHVQAMPASADKFTRAIPVAAAWNSGKILLPRSAPWLDAFVSELAGFTGVKDRHDDQVDALAGAFEPLREATTDYSLMKRASERINNTVAGSRWANSPGRGFGV